MATAIYKTVPVATSKNSTSYSVVGLILGVYCLVIGRLVILCRDFSVDVLFLDTVDFLKPEFENFSYWQAFFYQHGPHRQGLGALALRLIMALSDWHIPAISFFALAVLVAASLLALVVKIRIAGPLQYSDALIPLIFLSTNQYEVFTNSPNPAVQALPLLLILLAMTVYVTVLNELKRNILLVVIGFLGTFTGLALFLTPVLIALFFLAAISTRSRSSILCGLFLCLTLLSFFVNLAPSTAAPCFAFPHQPFYEYFLFPGLMLAKFFGISYLLFPNLALGAAVYLSVLLFLGVAMAFWNWFRTNDKRAAVFSLALGFVVVFSAAAAVGRICTGLHAAGSPRYMTLVIPFVFAAYLLLLLCLKSNFQKTCGLIVFALLVCGAHYPFRLSDRKSLQEIYTFQARWKDCYLESEDIDLCDRTAGGRIHPDPTGARLKERLDFLKKNNLGMFGG